MPSEWSATQNKGIHVHVESTREFSHTTRWQQKSDDAEGSRDTLKVVCTLKPRDAQSVTSLMLKHELGNVIRELRNLKTGQHENKRQTTTRETTMNEKIAHERTYDPRCEGARSVKTSTKSSCGSCKF